MISAVLWKSYELGRDQSLSWTAWLQSQHYAKGERGKTAPILNWIITRIFSLVVCTWRRFQVQTKKRWDAKKQLIWMLSLWCQSYLCLNEHITRNIITVRPQIRKFRIKGDKQLFLFFISAFGITFCLARFSKKRNKENQTN